MVFSYIRLRCSVEDAMARYGRWVGDPELGPPRLIPEKGHIDLALDEAGEWLGLAVFIYESDGRAIVEEISGGLGTRPVEAWLTLAAGGDLVYAACNDAVPYAQVMAIEGGRLVRNILKDESDPSDNVDVGRLQEESKQPFRDWTDVAMWVETDEEKLNRPEQCWLWIHRSDPNAA
jgi:hypothetical protein